MMIGSKTTAWSSSFLALLFLLLVTLSSMAVVMAQESETLNNNEAEGAAAKEEEDTNPVPECGLYLAVSSTSTTEEPKWGLYSGRKIEKYGRVGYGEVAIQTFHLIANQLTELDEEQEGIGENELADIVDFFEQYIWVPHSSGGQFEMQDSGRIVTAIPGVGVLGGFNAKLTNADWNHSIAYHREAWGEQPGVPHPGRGASSSFFEVSLSAQDTIPVGMEIFVNYGVNWDPDDDDDDEDNKAGAIAKEDYPKIDETVGKMIEFFEKYEDALDQQSKQEIYQFLTQDVLMAATGTKKGKNIEKLMPESPEGLKALREKGAFLMAKPDTLRSVPWLAKHGRCMDNLRPGPSSIPNAGRGAMATRALAAGSAIAPMPLVQIPDASVLNMYPLEHRKDDDGDEYYLRKSDAEPSGKQLLLNYCLGHPESKMLLFPTGSATSFINHSPEPNAKLVWSDHPNNHKHWFDLEPQKLIQEANKYLGLMMEVVALKDIAEGEEVTIDYGPEWAAAWAEHLGKWETSIQGELEDGKVWPTRSLDYNNYFKNRAFPLSDEAIPDNLMQKCFLLVRKPPGDEPPVNDAGEKVRYWTDSPKTLLSENLFTCTLTDVEEVTLPDGATSWNYTIKWTGKAESTWVKEVPHKAIVFIDKPGTSDQHVGAAFRHFIAIPDEIFPQGPWRNLKEDAEDEDDEDEDDDKEDDDDDDDE